MTVRRIPAVLGALMFVAGAAEAQTRTSGSGIPVSKDQPSATVSTTPSNNITVSTGDVTLTTPFDIAAYANMNEKNITAHMAAGDSLEMQLTQLALSKATNQAVRDYAQTLWNDHSAHLKKTHEIIHDEDVGAQPLSYDPEGMRLRQMLTQLRNMPAGTNWDAAFIRFQAQHHQNEIDLLSANIKNAHDDDLEDHIEKSIESLGKHRDMARSVATTLGLSM